MLVVTGGYLWLGKVSSQVVSLTESRIFVVESGSTAQSIAVDLVDAGIVSSKYGFLWSLWQTGNLKTVYQGRYLITPEDTATTLAKKISTGEVERDEVKVTFPEGWAVDQMAERLTALGFDGEEFLRLVRNPKEEWYSEFDFLQLVPRSLVLEGFLFPDTYVFTPDASSEEIVKRMLANFDKRVSPEVQRDAAAAHGSFYNALIVASVIEEEGDNETDRKIMADVFWKRLAQGIPFQSDVTVNYASGVHKQKLYLTDLEIDSPYNTYKYAGLMPTPISNPGLESILAAVYPTPNPYLYFITDPETGKAHYSETYEGHNVNRENTGL